MKPPRHYLAHNPYTGESRFFPISEPLPVGWKRGRLPN